MSKKSILMISQNFYPEIGSAANRMKNIYELLEDKYELTLLTTEASYPNKGLYSDPEFWDNEKLNHNTNINRVKIKNRKYTRSMFNRLLYYIEMMLRMFCFVLFSKKQFDVVLVSSPPIFLGIVGVIAKIRFKAKLILDVRDLWPDSLKGVGVYDNRLIIGTFKLIEKFLYRQANQIIINSKGFKYHIEKNSHKKTPIHFLPNSIREYELFNTNSKAEQFSVIYSGNIGLAQDIDFLKGLSKALNAKQIRLNIIGFGLNRVELQNYVKENNMKNVHFLKVITRKKCLELLKGNHVGVVCLKDEEVFKTVLPGKLIDYIACGLPIVAGASGNAKTMIEQQKIGYVADTRNMDSIVEYILHLKENSNQQESIKEQGEKIILNNFLWEKNIEVLICAIEETAVVRNVEKITKNKNKNKELVKMNSKVN